MQLRSDQDQNCSHLLLVVSPLRALHPLFEPILSPHGDAEACESAKRVEHLLAGVLVADMRCEGLVVRDAEENTYAVAHACNANAFAQDCSISRGRDIASAIGIGGMSSDVRGA